MQSPKPAVLGFLLPEWCGVRRHLSCPLPLLPAVGAQPFGWHSQTCMAAGAGHWQHSNLELPLLPAVGAQPFGWHSQPCMAACAGQWQSSDQSRCSSSLCAASALASCPLVRATRRPGPGERSQTPPWLCGGSSTLPRSSQSGQLDRHPTTDSSRRLWWSRDPLRSLQRPLIGFPRQLTPFFFNPSPSWYPCHCLHWGDACLQVSLTALRGLVFPPIAFSSSAVPPGAPPRSR